VGFEGGCRSKPSALATVRSSFAKGIDVGEQLELVTFELGIPSIERLTDGDAG
jgi:hypothetical protein